MKKYNAHNASDNISKPVTAYLHLYQHRETQGVQNQEVIPPIRYLYRLQHFVGCTLNDDNYGIPLVCDFHSFQVSNYVISSSSLRSLQVSLSYRAVISCVIFFQPLEKLCSIRESISQNTHLIAKTHVIDKTKEQIQKETLKRKFEEITFIITRKIVNLNLKKSEILREHFKFKKKKHRMDNYCITCKYVKNINSHIEQMRYHAM
ncbi:hypothetical protein WA026_002489 [Henosepilachna vigintioctopunctata]|uniref:Uncharacterized protein n=1 Tax=Henosepilachna vigintioctopunctata TaxID=420089 RepID=A0AAW1TUW8_9CUCU